MKRSLLSAKKLIFLLFIVFATGLLITLYDPDADFDDDEEQTGSCILPIVRPNPSSSVVVAERSKTCADKYQAAPVFVAFESIYVTSAPDVSCDYSAVIFRNDFNMQTLKDSNRLAAGRTPCSMLLSDVISVTCKNATTEKVVFQSPMRCIRVKEDILNRTLAATAKAAIRTGARFQNNRLNILMLGLDSMSRVDWLEKFPQTSAFLKDKLGGFTFDGYNIVGDGTTAAILGLTTGYLEEELHEARRGFFGASHIDDFPFIWRQLSVEAGYATLWDEDQASLGTFNYRLLGFRAPPVDFYGRIYQMVLEQKFPKHGCIGSKMTLQEMLSQLHYFYSAYKDPILKFAFVYSAQYTHTSRGESGIDKNAPLIDNAMIDELTLLNDQGHLNNSALIVFADHGSRFGKSRATERGRITERLPYLTIVLPEWFRKMYPNEIKNLEQATKLLTTPFDLHATLLDLGAVKPKPGTPKRAFSFFDQIPRNRTCSDAGISAHWCTCLARTKHSMLRLNDPLVIRCLDTFQHFVNSEVLGEFIGSDKCLPLQAIAPFEAKRLKLRHEVSQFVETIDGHGREPTFSSHAIPSAPEQQYIQVAFRTQPGDGTWEVTFLHNFKSGEITVNPKEVSRTNQYGSAPKCIQDRYPHLRQFCVCPKANK